MFSIPVLGENMYMKISRGVKLFMTKDEFFEISEEMHPAGHPDERWFKVYMPGCDVSVRLKDKTSAECDGTIFFYFKRDGVVLYTPVDYYMSLPFVRACKILMALEKGSVDMLQDDEVRILEKWRKRKTF